VNKDQICTYRGAMHQKGRKGEEKTTKSEREPKKERDSRDSQFKYKELAPYGEERTSSGNIAKARTTQRSRRIHHWQTPNGLRVENAGLGLTRTTTTGGG